MTLYLLLVPALYLRSSHARLWLDRFATPVPKLRAAVAMTVAITVTEGVIHRWLVPRGADEFSELAVFYVLALSFFFPRNADSFLTRRATQPWPESDTRMYLNKEAA
jgi:hypothetical protein